MKPVPVFDFVKDHWGDIVAQLPPNLEALAAKHGLLKYRRSVPDAAALLRLGFAYSILELPLRSLAAWGAAARVCKPISDVALMKQLQNLRPLVAELLQLQLDPRRDLSLVPSGMTLVDGTSFGGPGSVGTDWRINLTYSGSSGLSLGMELTTGAVGEHIEVGRLRPGDVVLGDRHYCRSKVIAGIMGAKADVLVRATRTFRMQLPDGKTCTPDQFTRDGPLVPGELFERDVVVALGGGRLLPMRMIILRKTDASAARTARKLRRLRTKKQQKGADSAAALLAGNYVYLLTSVSADRATAEQLAVAYRFRWQVELVFKRWKSLLKLDQIRAHGELARTYVLCKLLAATLIEAALKEAAISPWGSRFVRAAPALSPKAPTRPTKRAPSEPAEA